MKLVRDESGQAGIEVLPFGILTFVVGALLVANAWAVIDAKIAVSAAARALATRSAPTTKVRMPKGSTSIPAWPDSSRTSLTGSAPPGP